MKNKTTSEKKNALADLMDQGYNKFVIIAANDNTWGVAVGGAINVAECIGLCNIARAKFMDQAINGVKI